LPTTGVISSYSGAFYEDGIEATVNSASDAARDAAARETIPSDDGGELSHMVQFSESDEALCNVIAEFVAPGLVGGEPAVVIATEPHRRALTARLGAQGIDVEGARAAERLVLLDAEETLSRFMVGTEPDSGLFERAVGPVLDRLASAHGAGRVRAYGEMVDVLWRGGNPEAAIRVEEMWNNLRKDRSFALLCACVTASFYDDPGSLQRVCRSHTHVNAADAGSSSRRSAEQVRSLTVEISERKKVERALRASLVALRHSEAALRRKEEELRDFVENATVPLHWVGPDGTILWTNQAELDLLGYDRDAYVGRPVTDFHADRADAETILARLARNDELHNHAARLRAKDGSIKHVLISSNVLWRDGKFVHTRCFTRDVTEKALAEEGRQAQLQRMERLNKITAAIADAVTTEQVFAAVVEQVGAAVASSSAALWLVRDDHACLARASGYSETARRAVESMPLARAGAFPIADAIRDGAPRWLTSQDDLVHHYPHLAGIATQNRSYRIACLPIATRGQTVGAIGFTFDDPRPIDAGEKNVLLLVARYAGQALERVRLLEAEQESRRRAELLHGLAAAANNADRAEEVFEAALTAIEGALDAPRASILVFDADGVMRFRAWHGLSESYRRAVDGHAPWPREAQNPQPIVSRDVETDPAMAPYLPLFRSEGIRSLGFIPLVAGGRLIGKFMVYYDRPHELRAPELELAKAIANHVAAAISRAAAAAELQQTVRFNEMFTGILAHDLRNPLGAIIMTARLVLNRNDSERNLKPLTRIVNSGERMTRMIDQLLDFTRIRLRGDMPVAPESLDLRVVVQQVMDELEDTNPANPSCTLRLHASGDTQGLWDGDRLSQVFSNLVANALQHGDRRHGIEIAIDGRSSDAVAVTIHNQGTIPAEQLPNLFEPLSGGQHRLTKSSGFGLGLYITRELVKAHGGRIEVRSDDVSGTTFTVSLPRSAR
jgi:PAS domain S-box-containing protein